MPFDTEFKAVYAPFTMKRGGRVALMAGDKGIKMSPEERVGTHLEALEEWANFNKRDAKRDLARFWALKLPAIVSSAVSAAVASLGANGIVVSILAAAAALCIAIDGLWPGGLLYRTHKKAVHDIRLLIAKAVTDLDKTEILNPEQGKERSERLVRILDLIEEERGRIGRYLADAESIKTPRDQRKG